jgi:hypothetical protein
MPGPRDSPGVGTPVRQPRLPPALAYTACMNDHLARLLLLAGLVLILPIGIWHRLRARTGEKLDRRQEGIFILVTLRLGGLAGMTGLVAWLINPACMAWAAMPLPDWARWTGVGLGVLAGVLLVWMFRSLGKTSPTPS